MFNDTFLIQLAIAGLALLLSGPIALVVVLLQRGRIAALEAQIALIQRTRVAPRASAPIEAPAPPTPQRPTTVPPMRAAAPQEPASGPAAPRPSFEERFGTRWTVWVGGLALALGAILLVRYSVEQGFFGPAARIAAGFAVALGLLASGEALRRRLRGAGLPGWPDIPAMVTASGTLALFGVLYAAHALYGFIGPATAFLALGATGLGAMVAALLHGPTLAGIGLVGALVTPLLVGSDSPSLWPLTLYLPVVTASAYAFAWTKGWRALGLAAGAGAALWSLALALSASGPDATAAALVHAILQGGLAAFLFAVLPHRGRPEEGAEPDPVAAGALAVIALVLAAVLALTVASEGYGGVWIAAALAAVAIPAVAGFLAPAAAAGLGAAGLTLAAVVVAWPAVTGPDWDRFPIWGETHEPGLLLGLAGLSALAITAAGALRLVGGARLPPATLLIYAASAVLTPLAILALAYLRLAQGLVSPGFALAAGSLALLMATLAGFCRRQGDATFGEGNLGDALALGLGAFASAALAALALGLVFAVTGGSLTVAMALAALGAAAIARRLDIPALRWCVAGLGLVVAARLAYDPSVVGPDLGTRPILNWLLVGYGLPALAFGLSARLIRRPGRPDDAPVLIAQGLGLLLSAFLVFLEIRHALNDGDLYAPTTGLLEQGLLALSSLGFAAVLVRMDGAHGSAVIRLGSLAFGALALAQSLVGLGLAANPLLTDDPVAGGVLLNAIAIAYGLPALTALWLARTARKSRPDWYVLGAGGLGVVLAFLGLSLMIRHGFQGPRIGLDRATSQGEWYAYSAAWLGLGLALLAYGVLRGSLSARLASAALVLIATVKVFLFDLAGLDGPLRALSFLGLGAVLIGIGLVYQRFVFARPRAAA
jgi:uncharacterized membrane protein